MPLKRQTNKSDSENAQKQMDAEMIQNVRNPQHIAYCIENKATLSFTAFSEEFKFSKRTLLIPVIWTLYPGIYLMIAVG